MKFKFNVERNFLVRTLEEIELNPEDFLHCASIDELHNEIEDYIDKYIKHPKHSGLVESEELGVRYYDTTFGKFFDEWQKLKGLPQEL